jgi:hypothetical protein
LPVEPKPPSPRDEASKTSTRRNVACTTGTITICAIRSIGSIVNAAGPRFQPDQVAQHDAVLVAQAGARQQHRGEARVTDVDRQTGRDELRLARREHQRRIQARAQVEPGAAGRGVGGQVRGHARIEHLDVDDRHDVARRCAISATSWRASVSLSACGNARVPAASTSSSAL